MRHGDYSQRQIEDRKYTCALGLGRQVPKAHGRDRDDAVVEAVEYGPLLDGADDEATAYGHCDGHERIQDRLVAVREEHAPPLGRLAAPLLLAIGGHGHGERELLVLHGIDHRVGGRVGAVHVAQQFLRGLLGDALLALEEEPGEPPERHTDRADAVERKEDCERLAGQRERDHVAVADRRDDHHGKVDAVHDGPVLDKVVEEDTHADVREHEKERHEVAACGVLARGGRLGARHDGLGRHTTAIVGVAAHRRHVKHGLESEQETHVLGLRSHTKG